jgi:hypothetical protein
MMAVIRQSTVALCHERNTWVKLKVIMSEVKIPSGQYVDKNNCTLPVRDGKEWERTGKPLRDLLVAATLEKAITYVFAESPFRNAEAVGSSPTCSTNTPNIRYLASYFSFSHMANVWTNFLRWIEGFRTAS